MNNKGFAETRTNIETPNDVDVAEKPLKTLKKRVDINHSKVKARGNRSEGTQKKYFHFIVADNLRGSLWNLSFFLTNLQKSILRD